jgi:hypothetical protein
MAAILHNSSDNLPGVFTKEYYNFYYVTLLGVIFMADFLFLSVGTTFCNCEERTTCKVLFLRWLTKKCDLKITEVGASGTKQKTEAVYFFCKKLDFVLRGFLLFFIAYFCSWLFLWF